MEVGRMYPEYHIAEWQELASGEGLPRVLFERRSTQRSTAPRIEPNNFRCARTGRMRFGQLYSIAEAIWLCKVLAAEEHPDHARHMHVDSILDIMHIILEGGMYGVLSLLSDMTGMMQHLVDGCLHIEYKGILAGVPVMKIGGLAVYRNRLIVNMLDTLLFSEYRSTIKVFGTWGTFTDPQEAKRKETGMLAMAMKVLRNHPEAGIPLILSPEELPAELVEIYAQRRDGSQKVFDERKLVVILPPGLERDLWPRCVLDHPDRYHEVIEYMTSPQYQLTATDQIAHEQLLYRVAQAAELMDSFIVKMPRFVEMAHIQEEVYGVEK